MSFDSNQIVPILKLSKCTINVQSVYAPILYISYIYTTHGVLNSSLTQIVCCCEQ